jgi:hypothetical protein
MNSNKKFNTFFKLGNLRLEEGKIFHKNYAKQYNKRKNIARDHFLLSNAFNIKKLLKRNNQNNNNKEIIPENFYFEENKLRYKLNIYNYQKEFQNNIQVETNEDELLKTLLIKIDSKNLEDILKDKEKILSFQRRTLKGISPKLEPITYNNMTWKTFNKANSVKTLNHLSNESNIYKSKDSINFNSSSKIISKNNNSLSLNISSNKRENRIRNNTIPKRFYSQTLSNKVKGIFKLINTEEKKVQKNSNFLNYNIKSNKAFSLIKLNLKSNSINTEATQNNNHNFIKNIEKIKRKKDLEKILFKQNKQLFNGIRKRLHTLHSEGKKIPSHYLD